MPERIAIRKLIGRGTRLVLGRVSWPGLILVWLALTQWQVLLPLSLPHPAGAVQAFIRLWTEDDLPRNVLMS